MSQYPDKDPAVMYEMARDTLEKQLGSIDSLDAKLGAFFAVGSGLVGIVAALVALNPNGFRYGLAIVVVVARIYSALAAACLFGMWPLNGGGGPLITGVYSSHTGLPERDGK